jgi:hypothetical protein
MVMGYAVTLGSFVSDDSRDEVSGITNPALDTRMHGAYVGGIYRGCIRTSGI